VRINKLLLKTMTRWQHLSAALLCAFIGWQANTASAQTASCSAPGKDGPTFSQPSYYPGNATATAGSTNITLGTLRPAGGTNLPANSGTPGTTALSPGDLVMIIQMQDAQYNNSETIAYGDGTTGRGWTNLNNSGKYEFRRVVSFIGGNLVIDQGLANTYTRAAPSAGTGTAENGNRRFQVIRVPQFSTLTMPAGTTAPPAWNGETGGVWVVDVAGNLNMNGATIDASSLGFRGAGGWPNYVIPGSSNYANTVPFETTIDAYCTSVANLPVVVPALTGNVGAAKGEGIAGTPRLIRRQAITDSTTYETPFAYQDLGAADVGYAAGRFLARGAPGNAGGGGTQHNAGGGGGSNVGLGGIGGNSFAFYSATNTGACVTLTANFFACGGDGARAVGGLGGATLAANINNLIMGGGGGAGDNNNACDNPTVPQAAAGNGGGIIFIRASTISGNGTLLANGQNALPGGRDAAGGGGAGGTVVVLTKTNAPALTIQANGGEGGNTAYSGSGGVPLVLLRANETQGPGGGGGGGAVIRTDNITGFTSSTFNGGASGRVFPVNGSQATISNGYGTSAGGGAPGVVPFTPTLFSQDNNCLPQLQVNKVTTTPVVAFPDRNTAQYVISLANTGPGTAIGATLSDILPVPFQYAAATAPNNVIGLTYAGNALGPTNPTTGTGNTTLVVGTPGSNTTTTSFLLPPNTTVTFTVTVVVNGGGVTPTLNFPFQNSATVGYLDPFRTTTTTQVSPGSAYTGTTTVAGGNNYASGSSTQEDVRVLGSVNLAITKTDGIGTVVAGGTTAYTITVANFGSFPANSATLKDPTAAGLACTAVTCQAFGTAVCPAPALVTIAALQGAGIDIPLLPPTPLATPAANRVEFRVACNVTATGQ
jgi:uncharacterized repeat protein (TIGR01451 family)